MENDGKLQTDISQKTDDASNEASSSNCKEIDCEMQRISCKIVTTNN